MALDVVRVNGSVTLRIRDDARGFSALEVADRQRHGHMGLMLLEESAAQVGGRLTVQSEAGRGTIVRLDLPTPA